MIKGINKQILEVTNTDSPYFEKIIFFVRPEGQKINEGELKREAEKISTTLTRPPKSKLTLRQRLSVFSYVTMGIGAGIALAFILNQFIG